MLRSGLRALLNDSPGIDLIGESATVEGLVPVFDPDVIIASSIPGGPEGLLEYLAGLRSEPALLVVGEKAGALEGLDALPVRAWGVLPGDASEEELLAAVRALDAGLNVQSPELYRRLMAGGVDVRPLSGSEMVENLTDREQEVLQLLARGLANKQIALALSISEHTVKFHVSSIYGKLGASNRTEAVRLGLQNGLLIL